MIITFTNVIGAIRNAFSVVRSGLKMWLGFETSETLGREEVVNGDFALDSDWSEGDGWDIDTANNKITRTAQSSSTSASQNISFVSGKSYSITYTLDVSAGSFLIRLGTPGILDTPARSVSGTYTEVVTATANHSVFNLRAFDGNFAGSISNVSVREVTASDHGGLVVGAEYVDAQPRIPQLGMMNWSKGSNLLTYSNDFTQWLNPSSIAITPNYGTSPIGTQDASRVVFTGSNQQIKLSFTTTTNLTASIYMKGSGTIKFGMNTLEQVKTLSTNWQRFIVSEITGGTSVSFNTYAGTTARDIEVWGAQVEIGTSAGNYRLTDGAATSNSTVIVNPTIPTQDIFGNAVRDRLNSFNLDGSGYAEVADDTDLDFGTGDFSVEAWVKFEFKNQGSGFNVIYCNGNEFNDSNTFSLSSNSSSKISFLVNNTSCNSTSTFSLNEWVHVVGTRIQGTNGVKLYINGNATPEDTATNNNTVTNSFDKTVGYDTHSSRYYNNIISDVRVYSKALTSDEIENNYNAGLSAHRN